MLHKSIKLSALILFSALTLSYSNYSDEAKMRAMNDYMDEFLDTKIKSSNWNGNIKECQAGSLSKDIIKKAEKRINYFRKLAGISPIKLIDTLNIKAQQLALIASANKTINEIPNKSFKCYEKNIENVASLSCIGNINFEESKLSMLSQFLEEDGDNNIFCAHRRLMLFSDASEMGYGATNNTEVLYFSRYGKPLAKSTPEYIAYPSKGYFPAPLIFPKWSFAVSGTNVNYAYTTVVMKDEKGGIIKTSPYNVKNKIFDQTFVWEATGMFAVDEITDGKITLKQRGYTNQKIKVEINKVIVNGQMKNYEYEVYIFDV